MTITSPSKLNIQLSLQAKLTSLATEIINTIDAYKKEKGTLTAARELNVRYLQTILKASVDKPIDSEYKTPDALAKLIHEYLTSSQFITGFFNRSTLRDKIFAVLEKSCPLIFVKTENMQEHYQKISTDLEKITHDLEKSLQKIINLNRTIATFEATTNTFDVSAKRASASQDVIMALAAQKIELDKLRAELAAEKEIQAQLEQTITVKSDAIKRLETTLRQLKDKAALEKTVTKQASGLQSSFTMYARTTAPQTPAKAIAVTHLSPIRV